MKVLLLFLFSYCFLISKLIAANNHHYGVTGGVKESINSSTPQIAKVVKLKEPGVKVVRKAHLISPIAAQLDSFKTQTEASENEDIDHEETGESNENIDPVTRKSEVQEPKGKVHLIVKNSENVVNNGEMSNLQYTGTKKKVTLEIGDDTQDTELLPELLNLMLSNNKHSNTKHRTILIKLFHQNNKKDIQNILLKSINDKNSDVILIMEDSNNTSTEDSIFREEVVYKNKNRNHVRNIKENLKKPNKKYSAHIVKLLKDKRDINEEYNNSKIRKHNLCNKFNNERIRRRINYNKRLFKKEIDTTVGSTSTMESTSNSATETSKLGSGACDGLKCPICSNEFQFLVKVDAITTKKTFLKKITG